MLAIDIPGDKPLRLNHLVLDYNGTLAADGVLLPGVAARLQSLAQHLKVHVITADTFGSVREQVAGLPVKLAVIPPENQAQAKATYLEALGPAQVVAIGNGKNDALMLNRAGLGIVVLQAEGAAIAALAAAQVVNSNITDALDLLLHPNRLKATLRK